MSTRISHRVAARRTREQIRQDKDAAKWQAGGRKKLLEDATLWRDLLDSGVRAVEKAVQAAKEPPKSPFLQRLIGTPEDALTKLRAVGKVLAKPSDYGAPHPSASKEKYLYDRLLDMRQEVIEACRVADDGRLYTLCQSVEEDLFATLKILKRTKGAAQRVAHRWLRKVGAQVGTDTATIYAIAPEMLYDLIHKGRWQQNAQRIWDPHPGAPVSDEAFLADLNEMDTLVRQHGGAVFTTGTDGTFDVGIVDGPEHMRVTERGYMPPYGTPDSGE